MASEGSKAGPKYGATPQLRVLLMQEIFRPICGVKLVQIFPAHMKHKYILRQHIHNMNSRNCTWMIKWFVVSSSSWKKTSDKFGWDTTRPLFLIKIMHLIISDDLLFFGGEAARKITSDIYWVWIWNPKICEIWANGCEQPMSLLNIIKCRPKIKRKKLMNKCDYCSSVAVWQLKDFLDQNVNENLSCRH